MNRSTLLRCTLPMLLITAPAMADQLAADSCARSLSPMALEIYRAAAPRTKPTSNLRSVLTSAVIPLVMSGDMTRSTARPAAMAASVCLRSLQLPKLDEVADRAPSPFKPASQAVAQKVAIPSQ